MSDTIKVKTAASAAPAPVKNPATASATPVPAAAPPRIPSIEDSPTYTAAVANMNRLKAELARLEGLYESAQSRYRAACADKGAAARAVLAGVAPATVRMDAFEAESSKIMYDRRTVAEALRLAEKEVNETSSRVKEEVAKPYVPYYRAMVRTAAVAYVAAAKAIGALDAVNEQLGHENLRFRGGLDSPLPRFRGGDPTRQDSDCALVLRELIDLKILSETADAELLAGLAIAPPRPVYVPPAPKPPKPPEEPGAYRRALRSLGIGWAGQ